MGQGVVGQIVLHLLAGGGQQGADERPPGRGDAPQPPQPGPPGQVEKQGLGVVVGGVGGGDPVGPRLPGRLAQKGVPHVPGGLLQAGPPGPGLAGHVAGAQKQGDGGENPPVGQPLGPAAQGHELFHEGGVPPGLLPPELVVIVGGGQGKAQPGPQAVQGVEQAHRVGPAGHGAQHGAPRGDQVQPPDQLFHGFEHGGPPSCAVYSSRCHSRSLKVVNSGCHCSSTIPVSPWRFLAMMHSARLGFSVSRL